MARRRNEKLSDKFMYYCGLLATKASVDDLKHIQNLIDAEENGLLLQLPCKVGDTVFGLVNYCNACPKYNDYCHRGCTEPTYRLIDFKIDHFEIHNNGLRASALSHYDGEGKWGETVFATREELELEIDTPISILGTLDLRQYMESGESEGICNLSGPLSTSLSDGVGETFTETLRKVTIQTRAIKGNGMAGLHDMTLGRRVVSGLSMIPVRVFNPLTKLGKRSMPMGMTNLGNISSEELVMGGIRPTFLLFAAQVKKKPGMQLAIISLDGSPTLSIANVCTEKDAVEMEHMLWLVKDELKKFEEEE